MSQTNALKRALNGEKVTGRAAETALAKAVDRIESTDAKLATAKAAAKVAGGHVVDVIETQLALAGGSFGAGMRHAKGKGTKLGPVDVRSGAGGLLLVAGVGLSLTKKGRAFAPHLKAVGAGLVGSHIAQLAFEAGQKRGGATVSGEPAPNVIEGEIAGYREIAMTPVEVGVSDPADARPAARRPRLVPAQAL